MLKQSVPPELWKECKLTLPPITWQHIHLRQETAYSLGVYMSDREYLSALASAFRDELRVLYDAGLRSVQIDD
ncbi:hypothetical protein NL477_26575, partial [Klebsiella pneumoniae]|nr:hypothetical protein [Klebsiella pneumoniae]